MCVYTPEHGDRVSLLYHCLMAEFSGRGQARLGYLCQRSYSKMGEGWSDQPPVPANAANPTLKCVASIMAES